MLGYESFDGERGQSPDLRGRRRNFKPPQEHFGLHGVHGGPQVGCEMDARCASPRPKEKFSPGNSESWIMRSSGDRPAPATTRAFSSLSRARRVSFGRPEMNATSSKIK